MAKKEGMFNASQITGKTWADMNNTEKAAHVVGRGGDTSIFSKQDLASGKGWLDTNVGDKQAQTSLFVQARDAAGQRVEDGMFGGTDAQAARATQLAQLATPGWSMETDIGGAVGGVATSGGASLGVGYRDPIDTSVFDKMDGTASEGMFSNEKQTTGSWDNNKGWTLYNPETREFENYADPGREDGTSAFTAGEGNTGYYKTADGKTVLGFLPSESIPVSDGTGSSNVSVAAAPLTAEEVAAKTDAEIAAENLTPVAPPPFVWEGTYNDATSIIQESDSLFFSGESNSERGQELNSILSTADFQTQYVAGLRDDPATNPQEFFNSIHTMFFYNPEEFSKWQANPANRDMALRFHAMAAAGGFPSNDGLRVKGELVWGDEAGTWTHEKHQQYANVLGDQIRQDLGWGDEYERDGSMIATGYSGEYSKDVNNASSGGDFWKIGTSQKKTDGVGNFVKDNPVQVAAIVASLAFAPYATQAIAGSLAGVVPAAAIPAVSGGLYAAGAQLTTQLVTGQDLDLAGALKTGAITAATFGIVQTGAEYLTKAAGVSMEVAERAVSIGLETAANGGDLVAAVTDELISSGMELAGNALDGLTGAIGDFVTGDGAVDWDPNEPRPDWMSDDEYMSAVAGGFDGNVVGSGTSLNGPSGLEEFDIFSDTAALTPLGDDTFEGNIQGMTDYNAEDVGNFEQNLTSLQESGYPIVDQHGDELSISGDYVKNGDDDTWIRLEDANGGDGSGGNGGDGDGGNNGTGSNGNGGEGDGGMLGKGGVGEGGVGGTGGTGTPPPTDAEWQDTLGQMEAQGMPTTDGSGKPLSKDVEYDLMDNADGSQDWVVKGGVSQDTFEANMSGLAAAGHPTTDTSGEPLRNDGTAYEMDSNGGFVDPTKGDGGMFAEFDPDAGIEIGTTPEDITGDGALGPQMLGGYIDDAGVFHAEGGSGIQVGNGTPVEGGPDSWESHVEAVSTTSSTGVVEFTLSTGESSIEMGGFVEVATPDLVVVEQFLGPDKLAEAVYVGETMEYTGEMVSEYSLDGTLFTIAGLSGIIRDTYGYVPSAEYDPEAPSPTKPPDDAPKEDFEAPVEETPPEEEPEEEEEEEEDETLVNGVIGGLPSTGGNNNNYNGVTAPNYNGVTNPDTPPVTTPVTTPVSNPVGTPAGGPNGGGGGGGGGLGSASALMGNGTQASDSGNLFDYTKISPAAYAILAPLIDQMEGLK
jgi:hypothetical protein